MITTQKIIDDTERLLATKARALEKLYPENPYAAEFLDERQAATRKISIELLTTNIRELKCIIAAIKAL